MLYNYVDFEIINAKNRFLIVGKLKDECIMKMVVCSCQDSGEAKIIMNLLKENCLSKKTECICDQCNTEFNMNGSKETGLVYNGSECDCESPYTVISDEK